jgi:hypothetical protein
MKILRYLPLLTGLAIAPSAASAQTASPPPSQFERLGYSVLVGGGVTGFIDSDTTDSIDTGGSWEGRFALGTKKLLSVEAAYIGSAQGMSALGLDSDAVLLGTGVEGALRLNAPTGIAVHPYVLAGAGWTRYDVTNSSVNTADMTDSANVFDVPVGIGVDYRYQHLLLDARAVVRPAFGENLIPKTGDGPDHRLDSWNATARVGFEF